VSASREPRPHDPAAPLPGPDGRAARRTAASSAPKPPVLPAWPLGRLPGSVCRHRAVPRPLDEGQCQPKLLGVEQPEDAYRFGLSRTPFQGTQTSLQPGCLPDIAIRRPVVLPLMLGYVSPPVRASVTIRIAHPEQGRVRPQDVVALSRCARTGGPESSSWLTPLANSRASPLDSRPELA
jgi:hypothetical protein